MRITKFVARMRPLIAQMDTVVAQMNASIAQMNTSVARMNTNLLKLMFKIAQWNPLCIKFIEQKFFRRGNKGAVFKKSPLLTKSINWISFFNDDKIITSRRCDYDKPDKKEKRIL
jgi:hypothetical protein